MNENEKILMFKKMKQLSSEGQSLHVKMTYKLQYIPVTTTPFSEKSQHSYMKTVHCILNPFFKTSQTIKSIES